MTIVINLYLSGGADNDYKYNADILEYSDSEEKWTRLGELSKFKGFNVVSIVDFVHFKDHCQ